MVFYDDKNIRKKIFRFSVASLIFIAVLAVVIFSLSIFFEKRPEIHADLKYYQNVVADNKKIALTFDDGPTPTNTIKIANILKKYDITATFFLIGSNALRYPEIVKQLADMGFEIGNHSYTHSWNVHKSKPRIIFELNLTSRVIEDIIEKPVVLYRPPYLLNVGGDPTTDPETADWVLEYIERKGHIVVGSDIDPRDWEAQSTKEVKDNFYKEIAKGGHIVLLHDNEYIRPILYTPDALEEVIVHLKDQGYEFVSASEIFGLTPDVLAGETGSGFVDVAQASSYEHFNRKISVGFLEKAYILSVSEFGKFTRTVVKIALALVIFRLLFVFILYLFRLNIKDKGYKKYDGAVSVLVPAYNEEENIKSTLESILKSSYQKLEIIVIDDGSKDNTANVVRSVQRNYPDKIKLIQKENGGKPTALNAGLREAKYDVVVSMDADTVFNSNTINNLVRHFSDENVGAVAGKVCATESPSWINIFQYIEYVVAQNIEKNALGLINAIGVVPGPIGAWRKSDVLTAGGYENDTLVEDQSLTLAILSRSKKIVYEPNAVAYTETPYTIRDFVKQRFRWVFGTMQCLWKYKKQLLSIKNKSLGWIILPNTLVYTVFISILYPFVDALMVLSFLSGTWHQMAAVYLLFIVIDLIYAAIAFWDEKGKRDLILILPIQRIFYRFVIYYVVYRSLIKAIEGTEALWNKVKKRGDAQSYFVRVLEKFT